MDSFDCQFRFRRQICGSYGTCTSVCHSDLPHLLAPFIAIPARKRNAVSVHVLKRNSLLLEGILPVFSSICAYMQQVRNACGNETTVTVQGVSRTQLLPKHTLCTDTHAPSTAQPP